MGSHSALANWARFAVFTLIVLQTACATGNPQAATAGSIPATEPQSEYRIGPGDSLQVFVWGHPELSVTLPVRPDGMISTPLIENILAAGKTPSQLARDMETASTTAVIVTIVFILLVLLCCCPYYGRFDT
jgi:polysaccharide export outer membrane protein